MNARGDAADRVGDRRDARSCRQYLSEHDRHRARQRAVPDPTPEIPGVCFERPPSGSPGRLRTRAGGRVRRRSSVGCCQTRVNFPGRRTADPDLRRSSKLCLRQPQPFARGAGVRVHRPSCAAVRGEPEGDRSKQTPGISCVGSSTKWWAASTAVFSLTHPLRPLESVPDPASTFVESHSGRRMGGCIDQGVRAARRPR